DHAIAELGAERAGKALQLLHRVEGRCVGNETRPVHGLRAPRQLPRLLRATAAGAQTPLQVLVLLLQLVDALCQRVGIARASGLGRGIEERHSAGEVFVATIARQSFYPAHAAADAALAGDHEAAYLARGRTVGAAA